MAINSKLIAKNSIMLYMRMLVSMIVSLYTSRIVLQSLGVVDYGLYNVVGGVIVIFTTLKGVISTSTQRYFNFELGRNDIERLKSIFKASLTIILIITLIVFVLGETIGLWFVNHELVIPPQSMVAANVVYQTSIATMILTSLQFPYTASIIAHEKMNLFGYIGVGEAILRLLLVLSLQYYPFNKLITYSILILILNFIITIIFISIGRRKFIECRFGFSRNKPLCKELLSFTSWNLLETISNEFNNQVQNILLNVFFGPIINAARAVAMQVNAAIQNFGINFMIATFPQITKNYASHNYTAFYTLIITSSKFSFIVLSVLIIPLSLNIDFILNIWLKNPPEFSGIFCEIILISMLIRLLSEPLFVGIQAVGKIKKYQIITNSITLLNAPVCFIFFKLGFPPITAFFVTLITSFIYLGSRTIFLHILSHFPVGTYLKTIAFKCILVSLIAFTISYSVNLVIFQNSVLTLLLSTISSLIISSSLFLILSTTNQERRLILSFIKRR